MRSRLGKWLAPQHPPLHLSCNLASDSVVAVNRLWEDYEGACLVYPVWRLRLSSRATVKPRGGFKRASNNPLESERYALRCIRAAMSRGDIVGIAVRKRPLSSALLTRAMQNGISESDPQRTYAVAPVPPRRPKSSSRQPARMSAIPNRKAIVPIARGLPAPSPA